ncbi:hypothetical protein [Streptomyces griseocarneus]|uniref:hypothetical protein n=1 Tax=Streptomyces griseocarneus TaxID=51201 RepID=UPI00167E594F|nr:hypothetical protein [Streptomyces griseocarneus]MBZ6476229.1 hypothetical protein [Streptomyces griseocarneus]
MFLQAAVAATTLRRPAINSIRRAAAAATAGILLALGSVVVATPAHADNEVAKLVCSVLKTGYDQAQLVGCQDLE